MGDKQSWPGVVRWSLGAVRRVGLPSGHDLRRGPGLRSARSGRDDAAADHALRFHPAGRPGRTVRVSGVRARAQASYRQGRNGRKRGLATKGRDSAIWARMAASTAGLAPFGPNWSCKSASAPEPSVLRDQLTQHQRQDAAVMEITNLRFVVHSRPGREVRYLAVICRGPNLDDLPRLDRRQAMDRIAL